MMKFYNELKQLMDAHNVILKREYIGRGMGEDEYYVFQQNGEILFNIKELIK